MVFSLLIVCGGDRFLCPHEESCIEKTKLCDGVSDCYTGADESECGGTKYMILTKPTIYVITLFIYFKYPTLGKCLILLLFVL